MPSFDGFTSHVVKVKSNHPETDIDIAVKKKGTGKGLLLLHGYPQTSHLWNKIAPALAEKYTVIATDLRGYGVSSKPPGSETHVEYSKREMAADQVQVMKHFGFETFTIIAHDRGARVAHRLALDNPDKVEALMVLDIAPTLYMYEKTDFAFAKSYWHWFYLIQPSPGPEKMIMADYEAFWTAKAGGSSTKHVRWSEDDIQVYKEAFFTPQAVHASCEDYRAAATIDLEHDREDQSTGKKLSIPKLCAIWGKKGFIDTYDDPVGIWRDYSDQNVKVGGKALDCGHYIPEEQPEALLEEIWKFLE